MKEPMKHKKESQRDNRHQPYATCNVSALSVGLDCLGIDVNEDLLYEEANSPDMVKWAKIYLGPKLTDDFKGRLNQIWVVLEKLADIHIGKTDGGVFKDNWLTMTDICQYLKKGCPVLVGGLFTHGGHIICLTGFNERGFFVADPWGDWTTGYADHDGNDKLYFYDDIRNVLHGENGKYRALVLSN